MKIYNSKLAHVKKDGGLIMEYPDRLFIGDVLDTEAYVNLKAYLPDYILEDAKRRNTYIPKGNLRFEIQMNAYDIWLEYDKNRTYILSEGDSDYYYYPTSVRELFNIAADLEIFGLLEQN